MPDAPPPYFAVIFSSTRDARPDDGYAETAARMEDLPKAARDYVHYLGKQIGVPVSIVSVGPERTQTITDVGRI